MSCPSWRVDGESSGSSRLQAQMLHLGMEVEVEELGHQMVLATANAISSLSHPDSPASSEVAKPRGDSTERMLTSIDTCRYVLRIVKIRSQRYPRRPNGLCGFCIKFS
jgi:hypothetical protein